MIIYQSYLSHRVLYVTNTFTFGEDKILAADEEVIIKFAIGQTGIDTLTLGANVFIGLNGIDIAGEALLGETLEAVDLDPLIATVGYQWQRADAEDGVFGNIAGATNSEYKLTDEDEGKWVRVSVTGEGRYAGTVESKPVGPVVVETIAPEVDYNAVWNGDRGTWYIKVTVPGEDLDEGSVESIKVIKEAGQELGEPRELTPDTDKVLWFGVAKNDGRITLKEAGEYAYEVVREDNSKYIFFFDTTALVQGVVGDFAAEVDYNAVWNESRETGTSK